MKIFIGTHKPAPFPTDPGYIPIQCGKAISPIDLGLLGDNTGDNISLKMPLYSELCALYWLAHNVEADLVGLAHYRRYFSPVTHSTRVGEFDVAASTDFPELAFVDLIVAVPMDFGGVSITQQYATAHVERDMAIARGVVEKLYPECAASFDVAMKGNQLTPYNIFVGKMSVIKDYCSWLFPILLLLEKWIPYADYDAYQRRICAFMAERLFTVWLEVQRGTLKVSTRPIISLPY